MSIMRKTILVCLLGSIFGHGMAHGNGDDLDGKQAVCIALDDINKTWTKLPQKFEVEVTETAESFVVSVLFISKATEGGDLNITIDKKTKKIVSRVVGQ